MPKATLAAILILVLSAGISFGFVVQRGGIDLPVVAAAPSSTAIALAPSPSIEPSDPQRRAGDRPGRRRGELAAPSPSAVASPSPSPALAVAVAIPTPFAIAPRRRPRPPRS